MSRMDEFRAFVNKYPLIKEEVKNTNTSWQQIYENWVILGENDEIWNKYKVNNQQNNDNKRILNSNKIDEFLTTNNIKTIVDYVKKINPDTISKTLNTIQKVLQITQSFGAKQPPGLYNANYNSWWD